MKTPIELIDQILDLELEMFLSVNSKEPASCQQHPDRFRLMRGAQFHAWSIDTLSSYLEDLKTAKSEGENLMTFKYARMDDLISRINNSPLIEKIVEIQVAWQKELAADYPKIMGRGRALSDSSQSLGGASFTRYLSGELETYSGRTLESLFKDMNSRLHDGQNMTKLIYERMVADLGYGSLDDAEAALES